MENNTNNTNNTNSTNNTNETVNQTTVNETASTSNGQQESSSTYSYSYLGQEQKNPNNIWRADENTADAYTSGGTNNSSAYGSSTQAGADSAYSYTQGNTGGTYYGTQTGAGGMYGSAQTGTDNAYNNTQAGTNGSYGSAQYTAGNNAQNGTDNAYSNIYGNPDSQGQAGWSTYTNAKQQKKEERAKKRAAKKANAGAGSGSFGIKLAKCASIALVFGLVAGTGFEGSSYVAGRLLGTDEKQANISAESTKDEKEVFSGSSTKNTAPLTATTTSTGDVSAIVEECMPSIVAITNLSEKQLQNWFGQVQRVEVPSAGSGIIVSEDEESLYIATNNHVVESATTLTIRFCDDKTATAEIQGTDPTTDLAVVRVKKSDIDADTLSAIKVATLGDSDKIKVGSQAIAIGNALGYGQSVTVGYISALEREVTTQDEATGTNYTNNLIQTDAAINPGNSGGALLNSSGEVIGINSSKYSDTTVEGMGFAIPANTAKMIVEDLITKKAVSQDKAAYLGIQVENVPSEISETYNMPRGAFVKEVFRGTAAEQYGLRAGDIITKFDGRDIQSREALIGRLAYYEAGTQVDVVVQRPSQNGYEETTISVVLGKQES